MGTFRRPCAILITICAAMSVTGTLFGLGFDPSLVGLNGDVVTAVFLEPRPPDCPHKGMDISSRIGTTPTAKPFLAGVYGVVVAPAWNPAQWGSISVRPFNDPTATVQYIHCSSSTVNVGDVVAPWTVLGTTGDKVPLGKPVPPIHLHIQVAYSRPPQNACWASKDPHRDFVNPATFNTSSSLLGEWYNTNNSMADQQISAVLTIESDAISGRIGGLQTDYRTFPTIAGKQYEIDYRYTEDVICTGVQKNTLQFSTANTIATVTGKTFPGPVTIGPPGSLSGTVTLSSYSSLALLWSPTRQLVFTKGSLAVAEIVPQVEESQTLHPEGAAQTTQQEFRISRTQLGLTQGK